jgi:subtilisin family serine protease
MAVLLTVVSGPPGTAGQSCELQPAAFGTAVILGGPVWTGPLVLMSPLLGCSAAMNAAQLNGAMALVQRGTCEFGTKVLNAQRAGAIAAIVFDNVVSTSLLIMAAGADGGAVNIPSCFISLRNGLALKTYLDSAAVSISFPSSDTVLPGEGIETHNLLDDFSSRGPTLDHRFKPDIVCPGGNIRSALSFGFGSNAAARQCGAGSVVEMSGTSMATPSCAGASALVRQYFREGYHIDGVRNLSAGLNPTAALIKATMIHSGRPVYVLQGESFVLPQTMPDRSQGYGRVDLLSVLRFEESEFNLSVWSKEQVSDGGSRHYCLIVNPGATRLRVTVVWTDPPGTLGSNRILINDLDLSVVTSDGAFYYGNALTQWTEAHGSHAVIDNLNNAEQVLDFYFSDFQCLIKVKIPC